MKKNILMVVFIIFVSGVLYAQILDRTIAVVTLHKTENISRSRFEKQLEIWKRQTQRTPTKEVKETVLTATINDILISQAAEKAGIIATNQQINEAITQQKSSLGVPISDDDLKQLIESQSGLTWEEYREQLKNRIVQEQYIYQKYSKDIQNYEKPTSKEIEVAYDLYATEFTNPAMVRIEHLFWDTRDSVDKKEEYAKKIAKAIQKKKNKFDEYMRKSLDDPSFEGGDLGYIVRDESTYRILGEPLLDVAFKLQEGEVSELVKSSIGYHIIKITDKRAPKLLGLNDPIFPGEKTSVKDRVTILLINQKQQENFLELVRKEVDILRNKAKIKILSKNY